MATKNRKDNDLDVFFLIWIFGIVLAFASFLGFFAVLALGIPAPLLLWSLAFSTFIGVSLFVFASAEFLVSLPI